MAARVSSLAVHKNTVERRRKRDLARNATKQVSDIIGHSDIRAYAFVGIDAAGKMHATWDTGAILPLWAFASVVSDALRTDIENSGVKEDWRPALTPRGSTEWND